MTVSSIGNSLVSSMAEHATILKQAQAHSEAEMAVLSNAIEVQEELMAELLHSLGKGIHVDIAV